MTWFAVARRVLQRSGTAFSARLRSRPRRARGSAPRPPDLRLGVLRTGRRRPRGPRARSRRASSTRCERDVPAGAVVYGDPEASYRMAGCGAGLHLRRAARARRRHGRQPAPRAGQAIQGVRPHRRPRGAAGLRCATGWSSIRSGSRGSRRCSPISRSSTRTSAGCCTALGSSETRQSRARDAANAGAPRVLGRRSGSARAARRAASVAEKTKPCPSWHPSRSSCSA